MLVTFWNTLVVVSGEIPCSQKKYLPPGFKILKISFKALVGSGIEHNEKVQTTESIEDVGKSILSAEDKLNSISKLTLSAFFLAILFSSSDGSIPITLLTFSKF